MKQHKKIFVLFLMTALLLCGCSKNETAKSKKSAVNSEKCITVNEKVFQVSDINNQIKKMLNDYSYYHGDDTSSNLIYNNKDLLLNKKLSYDLYYLPSSYSDKKSSSVYPGMIYVVITNILYPSPSNEIDELYVFGINITDWGLRSDFCVIGSTPKNKPYDFVGKYALHLGNYKLCLDKITTPKHEQMDSAWKESAKNAVESYMRDSSILPSGSYTVYIQGFSKSDNDSVIIFKNDNGDFYQGYYYFVHDITKGIPADLNKVTPIIEPDNAFMCYYEKVRSHPALQTKITKV